MTGPRSDSARGEPLDPRMLTAMRVATGVTFCLAVFGLVPGVAGDLAGWAAVTVVVAAPLARVAWLGAAWARRRDKRFAAAAVGLLAVIAVGTIIAALRGRV